MVPILATLRHGSLPLPRRRSPDSWPPIQSCRSAVCSGNLKNHETWQLAIIVGMFAHICGLVWPPLQCCGEFAFQLVFEWLDNSARFKPYAWLSIHGGVDACRLFLMPLSSCSAKHWSRRPRIASRWTSLSILVIDSLRLAAR